jgi:tetratricopeptide (TPR) repeat protein
MESLSEARRAGSRDEEAFALAVMGWVAEEQGDYAAAGARYDQALTLSEGEGTPWRLAQIYEQLGNLSRTLGDYDRASACYRRCLALYRESGDPDGIAGAYNSLGSAAGIRGDYGAARDFFERSLAICRDIDDRFGIASACHNLGNLAYLAGEYAVAKELRREVLSICRDIGFTSGVADTLRHLGDAHRRLGEHGEAKKLYEESLIMKQRVGDRRGLALVYNSLGDLSLEREGSQAAGRYYRQAFDIANEIQALPVLLAVLCGRVACLAIEGEPEDALELLSFVLHHPACEQQLQDSLSPLRAELRADLGGQVAAVTEERGRARTLEGMLAWVVAGWEPAGTSPGQN